MKTQGEIEAAIGEAMNRFEQGYMGRGPKDIRVSIILNNIVFVRLIGVLTAAEQQLVKTLPAATGRDLLKQVRRQLIETCRPLMDKMILDITGVHAITLHHDISTTTGEEIIVFALESPPNFRELERKR